MTFFRPAVKEKKHADGEEIEPEASISGEDNAPGRRVILFKKKRPEDDEEREDGFAPYPVKDDEEFYIEEEEEEEEPPEPLLYDFLNVPFDDPTKAVKKLGRKLVGMSLRLLVIGFLWLACMVIAFRQSLPVPALKNRSGRGAAARFVGRLCRLGHGFVLGAADGRSMAALKLRRPVTV